MAVGVEGGKQVVREQVAYGKFDPGESSVIVELTHTMHASVKDFMKTNFASYLRLGEVDLGGLRLLCSDSYAEDVPPEHDPSRAGASSDSLGWEDKTHLRRA
ncbi:unnamed protein product [Lactuca virosa]|uniref:Peptidylprolyl isomerase n=1 Tax=Lactuca virosa TaxID=75947 RepID=A0AAU9MWF0_9ASTR|nr:unnamed protein product [Lactuca virosa]